MSLQPASSIVAACGHLAINQTVKVAAMQTKAAAACSRSNRFLFTEIHLLCQRTSLRNLNTWKNFKWIKANSKWASHSGNETNGSVSRVLNLTH